MWDECNCEVVWAFFGIAFLRNWNENWPFPVLWPLLSFPNLLAYWVQALDTFKSLSAISPLKQCCRTSHQTPLDWDTVLMPLVHGVPVSWPSKKALLFYFPQNSVSKIWVSSGVQRSSFWHHYFNIFKNLYLPKICKALFSPFLLFFPWISTWCNSLILILVMFLEEAEKSTFVQCSV